MSAKQAAQRRQNPAHGAAVGAPAENEKAPKGPKNRYVRDRDARSQNYGSSPVGTTDNSPPVHWRVKLEKNSVP